MAAPIPSPQPLPVDAFTAAAEIVADEIGGSVVGGYAALLTSSATTGMTLDETARSVLDGTLRFGPTERAADEEVAH
jgi:hypothetical protein